MPVGISYSELNNEITVTYDRLTLDTLENGRYYTLNGINARDFGYEYVALDWDKTTYDLIFIEQGKNFGSSVVKFQNYIHTGGSCGVEGGCNNGSPMQPLLSFENSHKANEPYKLNRVIYLKLWKKAPLSADDAADINVKIVINRA